MFADVIPWFVVLVIGIITLPVVFVRAVYQFKDEVINNNNVSKKNELYVDFVLCLSDIAYDLYLILAGQLGLQAINNGSTRGSATFSAGWVGSLLVVFIEVLTIFHYWFPRGVIKLAQYIELMLAIAEMLIGLICFCIDLGNDVAFGIRGDDPHWVILITIMAVVLPLVVLVIYLCRRCSRADREAMLE